MNEQPDYTGKRATIMGLGHFGGGVAAARWLAQRGAKVTITDLATEERLGKSLAQLDDVRIARLCLGEHRETDFRETDLVVVNPAVRHDHPMLAMASENNVRLTTEIALFMEACPTPIVGVTGSNGKSTTAAMTAAILEASGKQTWLGGNIGRSLLGELERITIDDWVVLELSSFQLWHAGNDRSAAGRPSPEITVVTGCTPNHLDWHETYAHYVGAKQRILAGQTSSSHAVLNMDDPEVASWRSLVRGECHVPVSDRAIPQLRIPGKHNRLNAACAAAAARAAGCNEATIREGLERFKPLPQRIEPVAVVEERRFYNDSTSTTPESTIAAVHAIGRPVWLLLGGRNKGCDLGPMVDAVVNHARGAALFGTARAELARTIEARNDDFPYLATETMAEAFRWCWQHSQPGDAVVLSPGLASCDQFHNFQQRGRHFVDMVVELIDTSSSAGDKEHAQRGNLY